MPKAYWISCYRKVSDPDKLVAYAKITTVAITAGKGRFLARGIPQHVHESGVQERTVVVEFPSLADAVATHDGPAYGEALRALAGGAERDFRIIEGLET